MTDNKGNKWTENDYEGYGEFGGKDFYSLLSEMNGGNGDRDHGIDLWFGKEPFLSPNLTEDPTHEWTNEERPYDCPNQGWVEYDENGNEITDEEDEEEDEEDEW
jgi:hypothetical protein